MKTAGLARACERLADADRSELPVVDVCEEVLLAFHDVSYFDRAALMTTDTETMLPSGGVVEGFDPEHCAPFWENELLDPDFNKFTELAKSIDPLSTLADVVDGDLARSPRYQKLYAAIPAADELRVVFTSGTQCLAIGAFVRPLSAGPFTDDEVARVREILPLATRALRRSLGRLEHEAAMQPPVVITLDGSGAVTGMTAGGGRILDDLRVNIEQDDVPNLIHVAATRARWSRSTTSFTTRLRGRSGQWLRVHVSPMEGDAGAVAVTVEPARPDDLVPILLDSYGLTERETEIALRLCRGHSTKEIAGELIISPHTVRDYVKAIYEKAGVSSRGELVARLFSNHVLDRFESVVSHVA